MTALYKPKQCYWCDKSFMFELNRIYHLHQTHPLFFEEYDKINDWFGSHNIPTKPNTNNYNNNNEVTNNE